MYRVHVPGDASGWSAWIQWRRISGSWSNGVCLGGCTIDGCRNGGKIRKKNMWDQRCSKRWGWRRKRGGAWWWWPGVRAGRPGKRLPASSFSTFLSCDLWVLLTNAVAEVSVLSQQALLNVKFRRATVLCCGMEWTTLS